MADSGNLECPECDGTIETCGFACLGDDKWECLKCGRVFNDKTGEIFKKTKIKKERNQMADSGCV